MPFVHWVSPATDICDRHLRMSSCPPLHSNTVEIFTSVGAEPNPDDGFSYAASPLWQLVHVDLDRIRLYRVALCHNWAQLHAITRILTELLQYSMLATMAANSDARHRMISRVLSLAC